MAGGAILLGLILGVVLARVERWAEQRGMGPGQRPAGSETLARPTPSRPAPLSRPSAVPVPPSAAGPHRPQAPVSPSRPRAASAPEGAARLAVIFDDAGGSLAELDPIIAVGRPVTVAVLPGRRFSREVAERARAAGLEVFLHLPLEPEDAAKAMGPGGISAAMPDEAIEESVRRSLASVPGAVGVNNHMGSRGTADPRVMRAVLRVVREANLVFVDSVTSPRSVAAAMAAEMGIPTASRAVFLDNEDAPEAIRAQLRRALALARRRGQAVAIGHATRRTAQVLAAMLGEFDRAGVVLVPASALAR